MKKVLLATLGMLAVCAMAVLWIDWDTSTASSHREAPTMMLDPTADLTDVYVFRDPNDPDMITMYMNVIPFQDPNGGPNFYRFDPNVLYTLRVDNDGDAREDLVFEFTFQDAIQDGNTFLYNTGPITSASDYNFQQTVAVALVDSANGTGRTLGTGIVPPENIGPASTPNYDDLAEDAIHEFGDIRVFAGQRDDPFFVDLGAVFDLLTIRPGAPGNMGGGVDGLGGFNVHTIGLQVPIAMLTADGEALSGADDPDAVIGVWAATYRRSMIVINHDGTRDHEGAWVQVSRLGLPLINEVVVPLAFKDFFNASQPRNDVANYVAPFGDGGPILDPEVPKLLNALYGLNVPAAPRTDLVPLLTGFEGANRPMNATGDVVPADMIRLNMAVDPVTPDDEGYSRLGVIAGDLGGYPNGRRLEDDVTDISLRVMAGVLADGYNIEPNNQLGDGVNVNDKPFRSTFPYMATPWQGYTHEHHPVEGNTGVSNERPAEVPKSFGLFQNYPNPFNPNTSIEYQLREAGRVTIDVYDIQGRLVQRLVNQSQVPGTYTVAWDGADGSGRRVASGTYIYRLTMNDQVQSRKMVLVK